MQAKKCEQANNGLAEKTSIVSNEGTQVSRSALPAYAQPAAFVCRAITLATLCALAVIFPIPSAALASNPLGSEGASVSMGFEQTYLLGKKTYVHRGIDLPGRAGGIVCAPCDGVVTFVGDVPAGDQAVRTKLSDPQGEKTMQAISIRIEDGRTVTLMPFSDFKVEVGQRVGAGEALGALAKSGDRSSTKTHLHMGLKKDGKYYDPSFLLGSAKRPKADARGGAGAMAGAVTRPSAGQQSALEQTRQRQTLEESGRAVESPVLREGGASKSEEAEESFGSISSGALSGSYERTTASEGLTLTGLCNEAAETLSYVGSSCMWQAGELNKGLVSFAQKSGIPLLAAYLFLALAAAAALSAALHAFTQIVVKQRKNKTAKKTLYGCHGGDNIPKLFPVPGTTFMTRGR